MKKKLENALEEVAEKVKSAKSGDEAMRYAQAALNTAHALATLATIKS